MTASLRDQPTPRRWNPSTVAPPLGTYSHLAEVPAHHQLVFISGQVGVLPDGELAGEDAERQTMQALENIQSLLNAAEATPSDLLRLQSFVAGREHLNGFRAGLSSIYERWFPDHDYPGHTLLVVQGLARPDIVVEIEAWFTRPQGTPQG
jgi:enamine deaminase RidA (YjgF/YER057c/UK114 family)